jgi:pyruvate carboxylase
MAANRGEIAIRVFRACTELGVRTLAIYAHADQLSIHRYKADEAFPVGSSDEPVGAYLDQDAILDVALRCDVDAIHPGYGFLAENAEFARRCAENGIAFIGPAPEVIEVFGDKTAARNLAIEADVPVVPGTDGPVSSAKEVEQFANEHGLPIIIKASFGGGGRGMRVVRSKGDIAESFDRASSEAAAAFGRGDVYCEKLVERAKHVEVQILADSYGQVVHLFERDCSVQRRHQKVVEIAPSVSIGDAVRHNLYQAALRIAAKSSYQNAGTVEFLVNDEGFYFIEVNPRIQVEHTVTECITGRDLVQAQIRIAEGCRLSDPEIGITSQAAISRNGYAVQCRITTEDPGNNFAPDTGKIRAYRAATGFGIRLDDGTGGAGTIITSHYDSLIVKLTAFAPDFHGATAKLLRSLREFRIRGVKTNMRFLQNLVSHPRFLQGNVDTSFIDDTPELFTFPPSRDRGTKLLRALANVVVNGPPGYGGPIKRPDPLFIPQVPPARRHEPQKDGEAMAVFRAEGAEGLSKWLRDEPRLLITDTTFRDAHQSLLATRVRTADLQTIAPATSRLASELFSIEMWGGATFDVAYRFLKEDPWDRLARLRESMPNILFQMLFRGANAVGYTNYADNVVRRFVQRSAEAGIDVFRIFDALNWVPNMSIAIEEVIQRGKIAEASLCYTGDISDPERKKYDLDYYVKLGKELAGCGAHILAIKDMAGLLKPFAARQLVTALRDETGLPVHLHTHDTSGNGIATYLTACDAGVDVVDCALSGMSGLTSQPSLNALCAALEGNPRSPKLDREAMNGLANYWERVRDLYYPFESGLKASTAEVYEHEMPGGQYSNLRPRAIQLGLGDRWQEIKRKYREVNDALGDVIKVTPTSKTVADFAMFLVQNDLSVDEAIAKADKLDFPKSLVDFLAGKIGQPYGGFPERLQKAVLKGKPALTDRAGEHIEPHDFDAAAVRLSARLGRAPLETELLSDALYPEVFGDYLGHEDSFGDVSILPTPSFLYGVRVGEEVSVDIESGKTIIVKLVAIGGLTAEGHRMVYFEMNGQPREVVVKDDSAGASAKQQTMADPGDPLDVGASMPGKVLSILHEVGDHVAPGDALLVLEAMKMETAVTSSTDGVVEKILVSVGDNAKAGELLVRLRVTD